MYTQGCFNFQYQSQTQSIILTVLFDIFFIELIKKLQQYISSN